MSNGTEHWCETSKQSSIFFLTSHIKDTEVGGVSFPFVTLRRGLGSLRTLFILKMQLEQDFFFLKFLCCCDQEQCTSGREGGGTFWRRHQKEARPSPLAESASRARCTVVLRCACSRGGTECSLFKRSISLHGHTRKSAQRLGERRCFVLKAGSLVQLVPWIVPVR